MLPRSSAFTILPEPVGSSMSFVTGLPARPAGFLYLPVESWQTRQSTLSSESKSNFASFMPYPMWQEAQAGRFVVEETQKLLMTWRLPSFCPASFTYSQVQCWVLCSCLDASLWQARQAFVTSGPDLKSPWSGAREEWSMA